MEQPRPIGDPDRPAPPTFTSEQLERELAIVEQLERRRAAESRRLGNE